MQIIQNFRVGERYDLDRYSRLELKRFKLLQYTFMGTHVSAKNFYILSVVCHKDESVGANVRWQKVNNVGSTNVLAASARTFSRK